MSAPPTGVLLMAYGSPTSPDDVAAYYTDIRRGRPPTPEQLAELRARYARIGGTSPLNRITRAQAAALQRQLGPGVRAYVGMKHWHPRIAEAVDRMAADGIQRAVCLPLAPHYSRLSVGDYHARARAAVEAAGARIELLPVDGFHLDQAFLAVVARRVGEALERFPPDERGGVSVLFTAHSLPARIAAEGDPYPRQLAETAEAVARMVGIRRWSTAWQSAGRTPEPWLGPDVKEAIAAQAAEGARAFLVCPVGFVADHLEVLYDVDVECQAQARRLGVHLERTDSPNAARDFVAALAGLVRARLARAVAA